MTNKIRTILGICLILVGFFWDSIINNVPNIPVPIPSSPTLDIPKPNTITLERVSSIADLVTDKDDRLRLAIFNMVFSERVKEWTCNSQQLNDTYVLAAKKEFGSSLQGKYEGYAEEVTELFKDSLGTKNSTVDEKQKQSLSNDFIALAYSLAN